MNQSINDKLMNRSMGNVWIDLGLIMEEWYELIDQWGRVDWELSLDDQLMIYG